jgi:hypothetical protein
MEIRFKEGGEILAFISMVLVAKLGHTPIQAGMKDPACCLKIAD